MGSVVFQQLVWAVGNYTIYEQELQEQLDLANKQTENITTLVTENIDTFNEVTLKFADNLDDSLKNNTDLFKALETDLLPDDVGRLLRQKVADRTTVLTFQKEVVDILNDTTFGMKKYRGWVKALNVESLRAKSGVDKNEPIPDIFNGLQEAFKYQDKDVKEHDAMVTLPTLICTIAYIFPGNARYLTYPLSQSYRLSCLDGTPHAFDSVYKQQHKDLAYEYTITSEVHTQEQGDDSTDVCSRGYIHPTCRGSVIDIKNAVNDFIVSDPLMTDADVVDEKQIICNIAKYFPDRSTFAFFDLSVFRTNCENMDDNAFDDLFFDAEDDRSACVRKTRRELRTCCRNSPPTCTAPVVDPVGMSTFLEEWNAPRAMSLSSEISLLEGNPLLLTVDTKYTAEKKGQTLGAGIVASNIFVSVICLIVLLFIG